MIDESKRQMIGAELIRTSMTPLEQERLERLEKLRRITPDRELPPMQFLFRLFGRPCFPRGELVGITGKAKSGKTFVTSMLMALCSLREVLSFSRDDGPPLRLLWIDTEQSEESTQDILKNRIIPMVQGHTDSTDNHSTSKNTKSTDGLRDGKENTRSSSAGLLPSGRKNLTNYTNELRDVFNLRGETWQERMPMLDLAIRHYQPDLVILDGIRDLVNDINDGVLAQQVIEQLMHLASVGQCCITCVLHQNKASEDHNLRGWIGTELMNKAFEVYSCEKLMPERIFKLEQTMTRKYDIYDALYYTVGKDGLPVSGTVPLSMSSKTEKLKSSDLSSLNSEYIVHEDSGGWHFDVQRLFTHAMQGKEQIGHMELQQRVMMLANVSTYQKCSHLFSQAINEGVIIKSKDNQNHVIYRPAPF